MNRKQLLAHAVSSGYKGEPVLADVKAYLAAQNIVPCGKDGQPLDIDGIWTKAATFTVDEDGEAEAAAERLRVKAAQESRGAKKALTNLGEEPYARMSPNGVMRAAESKSFNMQAARGETLIGDADTAEIAGAWAKLAMFKNEDFDGKAECREICQKAGVSYDFSLGGFAVPDLLRNTLIDIKPKYSALAQLGVEIPIDIAGESVPRRSSGMTVYSPVEGVAATESTPTGDQVKLTPFEMVALGTVSKAQLAKSLINFGEWYMNEMNYAIQKKLEEIYFLGTGSSTYFNQTGLLGKLSAQVVAAGGTWTVGTNATNAEYHSGTVRASGNTWAEITGTDTSDMLSTPADVEAGLGNLKWVCNRRFYYKTLVPIARSRTSGVTGAGVTQSDIIDGVRTEIFEGFPVVFSNAMPSVEANGQVCLYLADFATCTKLGTVPGMVDMSTSTEAYWTSRKIGYQLSMHKAVNAHDLGTANSTKPAQTTPFAALVTAES